MSFAKRQADFLKDPEARRRIEAFLREAECAAFRPHTPPSSKQVDVEERAAALARRHRRLRSLSPG